MEILQGNAMEPPNTQITDKSNGSTSMKYNDDTLSYSKKIIITGP